MIDISRYELRAPRGAAEWAAVHAIRAQSLYDKPEDYAADLAGDEAEGRFPLALFESGRLVATLRVDLADDSRAVFRRVAVDPALRGNGHGSVLLALAEAFVRAKGCRLVLLHARATALPFYRKHGFVDAAWEERSEHATSVKVAKRLA
jgi:phosphoribosylformimino-5-aminoimidazole carboxamide ribotide isomerase